MAPAPKPKGMARKHRGRKLPEREKPRSDKAVIAVLKAVTLPVPNLAMTRELNRLEVIVPQVMMMVTALPSDRGKDSSS